MYFLIGVMGMIYLLIVPLMSIADIYFLFRNNHFEVRNGDKPPVFGILEHHLDNCLYEVLALCCSLTCAD